MFSFQGNSGQKSYDAYVVVVSTKNLIFLSQISTGMASARAAEQEGQGAAAALPQSKNGGVGAHPSRFGTKNIAQTEHKAEPLSRSFQK